jgi:DNA-binding NtrC family response regulator
MISHTTARALETPSVRIVGHSEAMRRVQREALLAARLNTNVLITGERGVGKEVVARVIHEHSDRSLHGFATINCAGLPDLLVQSALFGHVKGSFAGAYRDKPGLVESVAGGTIFLDGVGALSPKMQARLLWFLETGEYLPVGSDRVCTQTRLFVRVIASTTADLPGLVAAGWFIDDLYRRLSAVCLSVPPLRERRDDIWALVDYFAGPFAGSPEVPRVVRDVLHRTDWPGNVRELKSFVLRELLSAAGAPMSRRTTVPKLELVNS